ncbi:MAG: hypothetical protein GY789_09780 [Hyphomicrobiales bacterium]|nr:hypothetical protein [Hyphomicrobiales bacterium]MCP5000778.1 hypothetical protein [Hyphomicrobiales bacterium]
MKHVARCLLCLALALSASACASPSAHSVQNIPELGRDLPSNSWEEASGEFDERVKAAFPPPTTVSDLVTQLQAQGFDVDENKQVARFEKSEVVCLLMWVIRWESKDGNVEDIVGHYGAGCL